jgi:hypothetical protein
MPSTITYRLGVGEREGHIREKTGTPKHDHVQAGDWRTRGGHQQNDRHIPNAITYILRVGEREEDISYDERMPNTITYILGVGEREEGISETMGTSQTSSRTC